MKNNPPFIQLTLKIDWFKLMEMGLIDSLNDYVYDELGRDENLSGYYMCGYTPIGVEGRDIVFQVDFELED